MRVPDIDTYIFCGENIAEGDEDRDQDSWYYQTPSSFFEDGIIINLEGNVEDKLLLLCDDVLDMVYDVKGVIELLEKLNLPS